jgi:hypothetical protein
MSSFCAYGRLCLCLGHLKISVKIIAFYLSGKNIYSHHRTACPEHARNCIV